MLSFITLAATVRPVRAQVLSGQLLAIISGRAVTGDSARPERSIGDSTGDEPTAESPAVPWANWTNATGDWGGLRTRLSDRGLVFSGHDTYDASSGLRGGLRRGTVGRGLLNLGLATDLEKVTGLQGGSLFPAFHTHAGPNGSDLAGDIQAHSNIDARRFMQLAEVWCEQPVLGDRLRVKLGKVDANGDFAVLASAGEFINASARFSPTIYGLPTYPDPVPSVNALLQPVSWLSLGGGIYRGPLL